MGDNAAVSWLAVVALATLLSYAWLIMQYRREHKELVHYRKAFKESTHVCGHQWCEEPEESAQHVLDPLEAQEGQHVYRPALLVMEPLPLVQLAGRDKQIFGDWKIKK